MSKIITGILLLSAIFFYKKTIAQVDLDNVHLEDIIGKVMHVQRGFAPKFSLGKTPVQKIKKVAEILGLKNDDEINRLFNTFRTGRTVYKVASYAGGALAVYGLVRAAQKAAGSSEYAAPLYSGIAAIGSGLIVKFLTKGASYEAVNIFNGIAVKKIKDIFSIRPATNTAGIGLYVKL